MFIYVYHNICVYILPQNTHKYISKCAGGVALIYVMVPLSLPVHSYDLFTHVIQGCFSPDEALVKQTCHVWVKKDWYLTKNKQNIVFL